MNNIVGWQKSLPLYLAKVNLFLKYFITVNFKSVSENVGQACWYADRLGFFFVSFFFPMLTSSHLFIRGSGWLISVAMLLALFSWLLSVKFSCTLSALPHDLEANVDILVSDLASSLPGAWPVSPSSLFSRQCLCSALLLLVLWASCEKVRSEEPFPTQQLYAGELFGRLVRQYPILGICVVY